MLILKDQKRFIRQRSKSERTQTFYSGKKFI